MLSKNNQDYQNVEFERVLLKSNKKKTLLVLFRMSYREEGGREFFERSLWEPPHLYGTEHCASQGAWERENKIERAEEKGSKKTGGKEEEEEG